MHKINLIIYLLDNKLKLIHYKTSKYYKIKDLSPFKIM